jgi:hypothetical protein
MKDETIYADFLITSYADLLNQSRLIAQSTQRSHKPAVSVTPLSHIIRRWPIDVELRIIKDVRDALDCLRIEPITSRSDRHRPRARSRRTILLSLRHDYTTSITVTASTPPSAMPLTPLPRVITAVCITILIIAILHVVQALQTVAPAHLEVKFEIEVRVSVSLIDASAFTHDLGHFLSA